MKSWIWAVVALAAFFFGGWLLGRHFAQPEVVETTRIDTVFYERPKPISTSDITVGVNVPKLVFTRDTIMLLGDSGNVASNVARDSVIKDYLNTDSLQMQVVVRTLEYRDSTYYARVVGPVIGSMSPRLDFIETYNKTVERMQLVREPYAWEFGPVAGSWITSDGCGVWAGAYARRTFGRFSVSASAGYDARNKSAFGQVQAGMALWRR